MVMFSYTDIMCMEKLNSSNAFIRRLSYIVIIFIGVTLIAIP